MYIYVNNNDKKEVLIDYLPPLLPLENVLDNL
jgi:hypothetical protein